MLFWKITGTIVVKDAAGWECTKQIPTTYFDGKMHGINNRTEAIDFAETYFRNLFRQFEGKDTGLTATHFTAEEVAVSGYQSCDDD